MAAAVTGLLVVLCGLLGCCSVRPPDFPVAAERTAQAAHDALLTAGLTGGAVRDGRAPELDRQIVDLAGEAVGKVDDVELAPGPDGGPRIAALLVGPQALGRRLGGRLGRRVSGVSGRLHPAENPDPLRIPWDVVGHTDSAVHLTIRRELLAEPALEQWLREHLISRLPGAHDAGN